MQTVAQSVELVSYVTMTPRNRVNQLARALVTAGLFPKSVGRDVKKIDAAQLFGLIAAVAFAENVADAPKVAEAFSELPLQTGQEDDEDASTLSEWFQKAMTNPAFKNAGLELSKVASGYTATIETELAKDGKSLAMTLPFWRERSHGGWVKRSFVLDPSGIEVLRNLFAREDIDGMEFK